MACDEVEDQLLLEDRTLRNSVNFDDTSWSTFWPLCRSPAVRRNICGVRHEKTVDHVDPWTFLKLASTSCLRPLGRKLVVQLRYRNFQVGVQPRTEGAKSIDPFTANPLDVAAPLAWNVNHSFTSFMDISTAPTIDH